MSRSIWTGLCSTAISTISFSKRSCRVVMLLHGLQLEESRDTLMAMYRSVEGELA